MPVNWKPFESFKEYDKDMCLARKSDAKLILPTRE